MHKVSCQKGKTVFFRRRASLLVSSFVLAATVLAACGSSKSSSASSATSTSASSANLSNITVGLAQEYSSGPFFEEWRAGLKAEAKLLNIKLDVETANGSATRQALYVRDYIGRVQGIVVGWGFEPTVNPAVDAAISSGIKVASYGISPSNTAVYQVHQNNADIASLAIGQLNKWINGSGDVIYVNVSGIYPLDVRNGVWMKYLADHPNVHQVAHIGVINTQTVSEVAAETKAALLANPNVRAVFAPYDAFAQGATIGINELGKENTVKVFGADTSTSDIHIMTSPNSPWIASGASYAYTDGAVTLRTLVMAIKGDKVPHLTLIKPVLLTSTALLADHVTSDTQLLKYYPTMVTDTIACPSWMSSMKACL